jgi:hypothetical protein
MTEYFLNRMQSFFAKPTAENIVSYIYSQIVLQHEMGRCQYRYKIPSNLSVTVVNDIIAILHSDFQDIDYISLENGSIVIDWS